MIAERESMSLVWIENEWIGCKERGYESYLKKNVKRIPL